MIYVWICQNFYHNSPNLFEEIYLYLRKKGFYFYYFFEKGKIKDIIHLILDFIVNLKSKHVKRNPTALSNGICCDLGEDSLCHIKRPTVEGGRELIRA